MVTATDTPTRGIVLSCRCERSGEVGILSDIPFVVTRLQGKLVGAIERTYGSIFAERYLSRSECIQYIEASDAGVLYCILNEAKLWKKL